MTIIPSIYLNQGESYTLVSVKDFEVVRHMIKAEAVSYLASLKDHVFVQQDFRLFTLPAPAEKEGK